MNKVKFVLFMAGISLALAFVFGCFSDSDSDNSGGNGSLSSSSNDRDHHSSSSSVAGISSPSGGNSSENGSLSSSSNGGNKSSSSSSTGISSSSGGSSSGKSSSSFVNDGKECDAIFNPANKFCYDGNVYDKCGGNSYNPVTQGCLSNKVGEKCGNNLYLQATQGCCENSGSVYSQATQGCCGSSVYSQTAQFCYDNLVYDKCDGMVYSPTTHICQNKVAIPAKCNGESYNPVTQGCCNNSKIFSQTTQRCTSSIVQDKCENTWYSQATKFCYDGVVYDKCGGESYNPLTQYCTNGTVKDYGFVTDDRDGKKYKTIVIGTQTWMNENLNYAAGNSECYSNDSIYCIFYGRLYNWATAMSVCPSGWHLPSNEDWNILMKFVNPSCSDNRNCANAGAKLKATSSWNYSQYGSSPGTNDYDFSALPGGYFSGALSTPFGSVGERGYWWSASEDGSGFAYCRIMHYNYSSVDYNNNFKSGLLSVRCVQD